MPDNLNNDLDNNSTPSRPVRDKVTKDKIDKHLRDIDDKISEDDIKNIKTNITAPPDLANDAGGTNEDDEPNKEVPSSWEILDE